MTGGVLLPYEGMRSRAAAPEANGTSPDESPSMKTRRLSNPAFFLLAGPLLLVPVLAGAASSPQPVRGSKTCDTALVQSLIDEMATLCPCPGDWDVKRQYKSCLRKAQRTIMKASNNTLRRSCIKTAFRCGSLSTCGEDAGVVTCSVASGAKCLYGLCSDDIGRACTTNADCIGSCNLVKTEADCTRVGGVAGTGSCCD